MSVKTPESITIPEAPQLQELNLGQYVQAVQFLFERTVNEKGEDIAVPISQLQTVEGMLVTAPTAETDVPQPSTYHIKRGEQPTYVVPGWETPVVPLRKKDSHPSRFTQFVIQAA